jgi:hypothetical protein
MKRVKVKIETDTKQIQFKRINSQKLITMNIPDIKFMIISRSGKIDTPGNVYVFTHTKAFLMHKNEYSDDFLNKFVSILDNAKWKKINLYFCDDLIINPSIYDYFTKELCARNIRDFWFQTSIDIFKNWVKK